MRIIKLYLENVKVYDSVTFDFHRGINFISGLNGKGKSTIFESIGLVLFNKLEYLQEDFVRYGEKKAVIKLWFVAKDELVYSIVRHLGNSKKYFITDETTGQELDLHGNEDIQQWLKENLADSIELPLREIFGQIIGVYQGKFTEPFLFTGEERKSHFNKLLQIEQYKKAFMLSSSFEAFFLDSIKTLRNDAELVFKDVQFLRQKEMELNSNLYKIREINNVVAQLSEDKIQTDLKLNHFETLKKDLDQLRSIVEKLQTEIAMTDQRMSRVREDLDRSTAAETICAVAKPIYDQIEQAQLQLQVLRARQDEFLTCERHWNDQNSQKDMLAAKAAEKQVYLEKNQLQLRQESGDIGTRMQTLDDDIARMSEDFNVIEAAITLHKSKVARQDIQPLLNTLLISCERLRNLLSRHKELQSELPLLAQEIGRLEQLEPCRQNAETLALYVQSLQTEQDVLRSQATEYEKFEQMLKQAQCPLMNTICKNIESDPELTLVQVRLNFEDNILQLQRQLESAVIQREQADKLAAEYLKLEPIKSKLAALEVERNGLMQSVHEIQLVPLLQKICVQLFDDMVAMTQVALGIEEVAQDFSVEKINLERVDTVAECLHSVFDNFKSEQDRRFSELTAQREHIMSQIKVARSIKLEMVAQEKRLAITTLQLERETLELADLKRRMADVASQAEQTAANLELLRPSLEELTQLNAFIETNRVTYDRYLVNKSMADNKSVLLIELTALNKDYLEKQTALQDATETLLRVQSGFEPETYLTYKAAGEKIAAQINALQVEARVYTDQSGVLKDQVAGIIVLEKQILSFEEERHQAEIKLELVQLSRKVLAKVGEPIADMFRQKISKIADNIYYEISHQHVRLVWGEGYEISLEDHANGHDRRRHFNMLSGGEQMSAALAVRMALIQYFSSLRIAFFDEPTSNLDETRRNNLAMTLPQLCHNFDQVFLISHDDTFDSITDNVILL